MVDKNIAKKLVVNKALRIVNINSVNYDPAYQRDLKRKHKVIARDFDEEALGLPLIAERADGSLWAVDGQQRIAALKLIGRDRFRAEVFSSQGPEHEARVFKLVNLNRTRLSSQEEMQALLTSGDPEALSIKQVVDNLGYKLSLSKSGGGSKSDAIAAKQLTCVGALREAAKGELGLKSIDFALRVADAAWPGDRHGTNGGILGALVLFYKRRNGDVDLDRLVTKLAKTPPKNILYTAGQMALSGKRELGAAEVIERLYQKRGRS